MMKENLERKEAITKNFSQISGFSFDYSVFKNWEVKTIEKKSSSECIIWLNWPKTILFEVAPRIRIIKSNKTEKLDRTAFIFGKNKNNAKYYKDKLNIDITFYSEDFLVEIVLFVQEGEGYSNQLFLDKVIKTFQFS